MKRLVAYDWPGNVRELRNVLERASSVAGNGAILEEHLPMELLDSAVTAGADDESVSLKDELIAAERRAIDRALRLARGNRTEAARLLGIHRTGLYQKMRQHGMDTRQKG